MCPFTKKHLGADKKDWVDLDGLLEKVEDKAHQVFSKLEEKVRYGVNKGADGLSLHGPIHDVDDLTFYVERRPHRDVVELFLKQQSKGLSEHETEDEHSGETGKKRKANRYSYDCHINIDAGNGRKASGRAVACLCFEGNYWSFTFRKSKVDRGDAYLISRSETSSGYEASKKREDNLNSIHDLCRILYPRIFHSQNANQTGLVVITGRTSSAKSQVARGLIQQYLFKRLEGTEAQKGPRRPHLLTFEDPIENCYFEKLKTTEDALKKLAIKFSLTPEQVQILGTAIGEAPLGQNEWRQRLVRCLPEIDRRFSNHKKKEEATRYAFDWTGIPCQQYGIDYTPRRKGVDAPDLKSVINDALRQTPAVLFVGETRDREDWNELVRFAGTGHLVFTTAHAGSLTEAMGNIFQATKTSSPAGRSVIADRILALVHLKPEDICVREGCDCKSRAECKQKSKCDVRKMILPAIWRNTPEAAKALMAEGRASILPQSSDADSSSLGRLQFAKELPLRGNDGADLERVRPKINRRAVELDLEGI